MASNSMRLTVNSHHDCCVLMNAVQEYCERQSAGYQAAYVKALQENDPAAPKYLKWRTDLDQCKHRTLQRLDRMRRAFENRFDDEHDQDQDEAGGGGYGYSLDNATCYN